MNERELSARIAEAVGAIGQKKTAGVLARSLLGISYSAGGGTLTFTDTVGTVVVTCTPIPDKSKN